MRADLIEAAKVTGPFTVEVATPAKTGATEAVHGAEAPGSTPVRVTAVELGEAPARRRRA